MKNEDLSISFSLNNSSQLSDLLRYLSSSNSVELECSFEREDQIEFEYLEESDIIKNRANRKTVPDEIKKMSKYFVDSLIFKFSGNDRITCEDKFQKIHYQNQGTFGKTFSSDIFMNNTRTNLFEKFTSKNKPYLNQKFSQDEEVEITIRPTVVGNVHFMSSPSINPQNEENRKIFVNSKDDKTGVDFNSNVNLDKNFLDKDRELFEKRHNKHKINIDEFRIGNNKYS